MAPTTPEGLLTLLLDDLPAGKTSHYAKSDPSVKGKKGWQYEDMAQVYLDSGKGPGMVRLFVAAPEPKVPKMTPAQQKQRDAIIASVEKDTVPGSLVTTKSTLPDGRQVTVNLHKGNCIAGLQVSVARENGWSVLVQVSTCLAWNGTANKPGRAALTQEQALKIAADPRIGTTLPAEAVAQGAKDFPHLPIAG
jgi:hypothetical protein